MTNEEMKKRQEEAVMAHEMALARKSKDELREIRERVLPFAHIMCPSPLS